MRNVLVSLVRWRGLSIIWAFPALAAPAAAMTTNASPA
jgi:hypothetical protein